MEKVESYKLKNKKKESKKKKSLIPDEAKADFDRLSAGVSSKSRLSTECELKLHDSITDSMVDSISEGIGSMIAQRLPSSTPQLLKLEFSKKKELNQTL